MSEWPLEIRWKTEHCPAHNDYVEIATDFGLTGLGILGVLVGLTLWTAVRIMSGRKSPLPWGIAFGVAMSIVALGLHSTVDFNLQIPANALTMVIILAMAWIAKALPRGAKTASQQPRIVLDGVK